MPSKRLTCAITLTVLTAATAVGLSRCETDKAPGSDVQASETVYDRVACGFDLDADTCASQEASARAEYMQSAPQYASNQECDAAVGRACVENPDIPGMFMPAMAGFLLGRAASGALSSTPVYAGSDPSCGRPGQQACPPRSSGGSGGFIYTGRGYYGTGTMASGDRVASVARSPSVETAFRGGSAFGRGGISGTHGGMVASEGFSGGHSVSVSHGGLGASAGAHSGGGE